MNGLACVPLCLPLPQGIEAKFSSGAQEEQGLESKQYMQSSSGVGKLLRDGDTSPSPGNSQSLSWATWLIIHTHSLSTLLLFPVSTLVL